MKKKRIFIFMAVVNALSQPMSAQNLFHRVDSIITSRYYDTRGIDTTYISRPTKKWTLTTRMNVSGSKIKSEGIDNNLHYESEMVAERKATLSLGVSYLGLSFSVSLNPAKLAGMYHDFELNFNSYGRRLGFDISYQDAKNFSGWHDHEGMKRIELPDGLLSVKTFSINAFYIFNSSRFSYPAAFSQSYIQRRSAGSFLLAMSGQVQHAKLEWEQKMNLKTVNIGIGAGYGYNYVPGRGWLLHISTTPSFIVYSNTSMTFGDNSVPLHYHFPEVIITGRGAVVRQWGNNYLGMSMIFNFSNIGNKENLAVHNTKWLFRTFFGLRLGK